ncbi:MAG: FAD:protein FMN transferase [Bacteroidales bacterium]|nr:FAD:protein FMN transferase [Bacteroidales bacterium]
MNSFTRKLTLFSLLCMILLSSCRHRKEPVLIKIGGETQGTYYAITYYHDDSTNLQPSLDSLFRRFDSTASTYKPNSIISRMNNNDPSVRADEMFSVIFQKAMEVSEKTKGAFDITVGPLVSAWGFGLGNRVKMNHRIVDSLMPLVGYHKVMLSNGKLIKTDPRIRIDYNAIAQGYAVDVVAGFLDSKGIQSYLIDIGGEVLARRTKPGGEKWSVAIEMPAKTADEPRKIQAVVMLQDMAISTSGSYRKFYEENGVRYSHTIDPSNGYPVKHTTLSVSVLAKDCITADAYATAFMVMGVDKGKEYLKKHPKLDVYFIYTAPDGSMNTYYTKGFRKHLRNDK